ncbi:GH25 family lysozyme [Kitasatospora viridis]|uniref:Putative peptidoglycan binding protein n=1 Tax=Kitasatospora viridis TaxID=281105 RepID=A0A561UMM5_9ACTN|nr:GH25 family lysozyme [Kitasatospora viridis]TWG00628.1 putative peptidoglycan binding protein [Kitasatospora viridis]
MGVYGQDWASYQSATPDTTGLSFAFIKVSQGLTYTNPEWTAQRDHARAAGLVVGYYHYPEMANSWQQEADRFLSLAQPQAGELVCLDWEGYDTANEGVSHADQLGYKQNWLRYVKGRLPHNPVGLYCNTDYWNNVDTTGYVQDFLWIATSGRPAGQPGISANWLFHQYSDSGDMDQDYCNLGSTDALRSWALGFAPPAQPAPPTGPAWPGEDLSLRQPLLHDANVRTWQQRIHDRGWPITVDGWYGPQSKSVCEQFQQDSSAHGWPLTVDGIVGQQTWNATWQRPVS